MKFNRKLFRIFGVAAVLATVSAGPDFLTAQIESVPPGGGCEFKTRWMDAHGQCPSCCDAREFSCPCTI